MFTVVNTKPHSTIKSISRNGKCSFVDIDKYTYEGHMHFDMGYGSTRTIDQTTCPHIICDLYTKAVYSRIVPFSAKVH